MTTEDNSNHIYLGDGVYAEHTPHGIILRTGSHLDRDCDDIIYLDNKVLRKFIKFLDSLKDVNKK